MPLNKEEQYYNALHFGLAIPLIGNHVTKNKEAYKYLEESISQFPNQSTLLSKLNKLGFKNTSVINLFDGIVAIHKGFKIL